MLLPLTVLPESRIQTGAARAALSTTAHVIFGNDCIAGAETVAIMSNSRSVTLNATVRTPAAAPADTRGRVSVDTHQVICTASMP